MTSAFFASFKQEIANTVEDFKTKGPVAAVADAAFDVAEIVQSTFSETVHELQQNTTVHKVREAAADVGDFVHHEIAETVNEFLEKGALGVAEDVALDVGEIVVDASGMMLNASDHILNVTATSSILDSKDHENASYAESSQSPCQSNPSGMTENDDYTARLSEPARIPVAPVSSRDTASTSNAFRRRCYKCPPASWRHWAKEKWYLLRQLSFKREDYHDGASSQDASTSSDSDVENDLPRWLAESLKSFRNAFGVVRRAASLLSFHSPVANPVQGHSVIKVWHLVSVACAFDVFVPLVGLAHWAPLNVFAASAGAVWAFHWVFITSIQNRSARLSFLALWPIVVVALPLGLVYHGLGQGLRVWAVFA